MRSIINDDVFLKKGFIISTDKFLLDFDIIYNFLNEDSYWAQGITQDRLKMAIENSMCFGIYHQNKQVAFARIITDMATFAYIADVFVIPDYRGKGLSKWLIQAIIEYPGLKGLKRWLLATEDAHGLYSQFGFAPISKPDRWMEIFTPYVKAN